MDRLEETWPRPGSPGPANPACSSLLARRRSAQPQFRYHTAADLAETHCRGLAGSSVGKIIAASVPDRAAACKDR
jgi:hypothetical protein